MPKTALVDSQGLRRESKSNSGTSIETYGSANATENGKRYSCSSWMYDCRREAFLCLLCQDLQAGFAHIEEDKHAARLRLVEESGGYSAKGTFQLSQTYCELNFHRAIPSSATLNPILPIPAATRRITFGENAGFHRKLIVTPCISYGYKKDRIKSRINATSRSGPPNPYPRRQSRVLAGSRRACGRVYRSSGLPCSRWDSGKSTPQLGLHEKKTASFPAARNSYKLIQFARTRGPVTNRRNARFLAGSLRPMVVTAKMN
jgi:hypothetical protein